MERIVRVLIFGVAIIDAAVLLGRSADYFTGDPSQQIRDFDTGGAIFLWAVMCVIPAVGLISAVGLRNIRVLVWSGIATSIAYFCFGMVSLSIVFAPPIDDWRLAFDCFGASARWALIPTMAYAYAGVLNDREDRKGGGADGSLDGRFTSSG